jgi:hypothetical protein
MNPGRDDGGEGGTMKPGDSGWVHATVDQVFKDETFFVNAGGFCCEADMLPDHPALPKIAAWLQEHPDAATALHRCFCAATYDEAFSRFDVYESDRDTVRSLIAALTPDAPETEGATNER